MTVKKTVVTATKANGQRKAAAALKGPLMKKACATRGSHPRAAAPVLPTMSAITPVPGTGGEELVPAVLAFSLEEAKQHLISVYPRLEDVFRRVKCKPDEHIARVESLRYAVHVSGKSLTDQNPQHSRTLLTVSMDFVVTA